MRTKFILPVHLVIEIQLESVCDKFSGWSLIRNQGDVLPCAFCGNYAETKTYKSPDGLYTKDICTHCETNLGLQ
jgi:hypothetical protein